MDIRTIERAARGGLSSPALRSAVFRSAHWTRRVQPGWGWGDALRLAWAFARHAYLGEAEYARQLDERYPPLV